MVSIFLEENDFEVFSYQGINRNDQHEGLDVVRIQEAVDVLLKLLPRSPVIQFLFFL